MNKGRGRKGRRILQGVPCHAVLSRIVSGVGVGSPLLRLVFTDARFRQDRYRQVFAGIYELAAELERRCDTAGVTWVVSPYVHEARIVIEQMEGEDPAPAEDLLRTAIADLGLVE